MSIFQDPAFLPITIIFLVLLVFALWQKLDKYIIPLFIVYVVYITYTAITFNEILVENIVSSPELIEPEVIDDIDEHVQPVEITMDTGRSNLKLNTNKIEESPTQTLPDLHVNTFLFCEIIIDSVRKPVKISKEFPIDIEKVYCYSGIRNITGARTILYEWYFNNQYIEAIPVNIGRSVHWRSWTYKTIKNAQVGQWYVVLKDELTKAALDTAFFTMVAE
ncbi:MAG: DUF2914 domain-containing protein [Fidelibacterota bacterium]